MQLTYPIGTPICDGRKTARSSSSARSSIQPDIDAKTTVAGAYAASFGGFVTQSNVGQIHVFLKDESQEHRPTTGCSSFSKIAKQHSRPTCRRSSFRRPGTGGGNTQPIDLLVTDRHRGRPDAIRAARSSLLADTSRRDERQQHGHAARARDLDSVRSQEGAGARRGSGSGGGGRRRRVRRRRRDAVRDAVGPRTSAGHLPARRISTTSESLKAVAIRSQNGVDRLSRRHRAIRSRRRPRR